MKIGIPHLLALASAAAMMAASPSAAYFKGDVIYASDEATYCKSIEDLQKFSSLIKAKETEKAGKMTGCGTFKKDTSAIALDTSFHGYALVQIKAEKGPPSHVYVQKNLWWTKQEETYFTCMRVHGSEPFLEAYKRCQDEMVSGVDPKANPDLAVAYQCAECHGATDKKGNPNLVGISKDYLLKSMNAYKTGDRKDKTMGRVADKLSEEEAARAANYFADRPCK